MTYHTKSTGLASVAALAVGAMLAFAPMKAEAIPVELNPTPDILSNGTVQYDIRNTGTSIELNDGNDYTLGFAINISGPPETQFEFTVFGTGTLTLDLFVDPFAPGGVGTADVRIGTGPAFAEGAHYTAQWGTGPSVDLTDGLEKVISTSFFGTGSANAQQLVFDWEGVTANARQTSVGVSTVPLPASALLLLGGLGGLGGLSALRRRKRAA